ncbi:hypothetical protein [Psychromonas algicola]|uniref:hypothetical protein n=1 Tax=Psychromonas algicola TaxID=2555642 RepID=UPI00106780CA|nr:hypothetical protein [Psychromonas sp. RZ5]TEW46448.1 hypothetical protein E2R67_13135 [Psychromonas sp. RZ5]
MIKKVLIASTMLTATVCATTVNASEALHQAMSAAMGEAIEDARYLQVLANYGMPVPDFNNDKSLVNSTDYKYPTSIEKGSLLQRVLDTETLRLGWIAVGSPWSMPGKDNEPIGLSVEYWAIIQDKLNAHYNKNIKLDWVEYTSKVGNNDMYKWLATDNDQDCVKLNTGSIENCYDIIGGAYAINARRKALSYMSPAYYPLNMSVVRTRTPFKDPTMKLNSAEEILAAIADPKSGLIIAGYEDTGEHSIMNGWKKKYGNTFTMNFRTPQSNVLEYAETAGAHFVMGTNARLAVTRQNTPEFCAECEFIPNILVFGGVGFATSLPENNK